MTLNDLIFRIKYRLRTCCIILKQSVSVEYVNSVLHITIGEKLYSYSFSIGNLKGVITDVLTPYELKTFKGLLG